MWTSHSYPARRPVRATRIRSLLLLLLACAAGGVDAVSYAGLGHIFTANMTGNTVLLGLAIGQIEGQAAARSSVALVGFLVGVALGAWVVNDEQERVVWPPAVTAALGLEWVVLVVWAVGWYMAGNLEVHHAARAALIVPSALAMGVQSAVGRRLHTSGVVTTYISGTLTYAIMHLVDRRQRALVSHTTPRPAAVQTEPGINVLAATWAIYIAGAAASSVTIAISGMRAALFIPIALLAVVTLAAGIVFRWS